MPSQTISSPAVTSAAGNGDAATSITDLHPDILQTQILTRLDGPSLAAAAATSPELHRLAGDHSLWSHLCRSTWPSTATLHSFISQFPLNGPHSFFSNSFPNNSPSSSSSPSPPANPRRPPELISAVDIHHRGDIIFSKVVQTETVSGWFRCSPFRIDMLDPKHIVSTPIGVEKTCRELAEELTLSWIVIDTAGRRAMNLSSYRAVSVQRHWLSGEIHVRFAAVLAGDVGSATECVQCGIAVTCAGSERGNLLVREVNLQVEDMDGIFLKGEDSLVILDRALEGKSGRKKLEEFIEMKKERKEKKLRREGTLDMVCLAFGFVGFAALSICLLFT